MLSCAFRKCFAATLHSGCVVRSLAKTAADYYASLAAHGSTQPFRDRMLDFDELNSLIGTPEMIERGKRLQTIPPGHEP